MTKQTFTTKLAVAAVLLSALVSCQVDQLYTKENMQDVDLTVTLFEKGLELPIGSTAPLRVDSLLSMTGLLETEANDYIYKDESGNYWFNYSGHLDLDSTIAEIGLADMLDIDAVDFDGSFEYEIGNIDAESIKVNAQEFGTDVTINDLTSSINNVKVDDIAYNFDHDAGVAGINYGIDINLPTVNETKTILELAQMKAAGALLPGDTFTLPGSYFTPTVDFGPKDTAIPVPELPSQVKSIDDIQLDPSAEIVITISLENSVLSSGSVTPEITIATGGILTFDGGSSSLSISGSSLSPSSPSFTKKYTIKDVDPAKLLAGGNVTVSGSVTTTTPVISKSLLSAASSDMKVVVEVSYNNFKLKNIQATINPIEFSIDTNYDIPVAEVTLPSEIKEIKSVTFTSDSKLTLNVSVENMLSGLAATANEIVVTFPEGMHVSGTGVSGQKLTIKDAVLTSPIVRTINVESIDLPTPDKNNAISYTGNVTITAKAGVSGQLNTADVPSDVSKDVRLKGTFTGVLAVDDYDITVNQIANSVDVPEETIHFDLSSAVGEFGTLKVTPKGSPKMVIDLTIPDTGSLTTSTGDGIVVTLPDVVVFGDVPAALNYNESAHSITISDLVTAKYELPISYIQITPIKNGDSYYCESKYSVKGSVVIEESSIDKSTVNKLSGATFSVKASIPEISAGSVSLEKLSYNVDETTAFEIIKASDIPAEVASIGKIDLNDNSVNLSVDIDGLPDLGGGKFVIDLTADMPSFIKPSKIDLKGELTDGKFNVSQPLEALDFSDFDLAAMRASGSSIGGELKISGSIYAENPCIALDQLEGDVTCSYSASVGDSKGKIALGSATARINYGITATQAVDLSSLSGIGDYDITLDLPKVNIELDVTADTAIPLEAHGTLVPWCGGKASADSTEFEVKFPYSSDGSLQTTVNSIDFDLNPYFNSDPAIDSLRVNIYANTDPETDTFIDINKEYKVGVDYKVSMPITLGANTSASIRDTMEIKDFAKYFEGINFGLKGTVENTMPLGVKATFLLADENSKPVDVLKNEACLDIEPGYSGEYSLVLDANEFGDKNIENLIIQIDVSSNGVQLKDDEYIKLSVIAVLPEGFTADINSFTEKSETE